MQDKINNMTIALAGLVQSVSLISDLAQTGKFDEKAYESSINSLFQTHPESPADVFGDMKHIQIGLEKLINVLNPTTDHSRRMARDVLALMRIQKKVSHSSNALNILLQRIEQAKKQVAYFSLTHPTVIANLADIYLSIITPFRFRFFILGNQQILGVHENMDKIRALLLAGIRASVLWRQIGGSRFQLLLSARKIRKTATDLLKKLAQENNT